MTDEISGMSWRTIARSAYKAYGAKAGWKNYQGLPMPQWEDLTSRIQDCWEAAVRQTGFCLTGLHPGSMAYEPTDEYLSPFEEHYAQWESPFSRREKDNA